MDLLQNISHNAVHSEHCHIIGSQIAAPCQHIVPVLSVSVGNRTMTLTSAGWKGSSITAENDDSKPTLAGMDEICS